MASTDSERRLVLVWPLLLTGLIDLQVDGKYRLRTKIGSGMAPLTDWTDGPLLLTGLMDLQVDGKYRLGQKIGSGMAPLTNQTDGPES